MESVFIYVFYTFAFFAVYVQVFLLVTFLERRKHLAPSPLSLPIHKYPTVTITVPCYNEEKTVEKTVQSLLLLDYPKDKLSIFLVDDGSIDNTWNIMRTFESHPNIKIFQQKNGGKHTALNLGLAHAESEFVGCLDADSIVDKEALKHIVGYFENHPHAMAVLPSILVDNPSNIIEKAQKVEYEMAIYTKKMLGFTGGIHVTPGPFSIFRKKVFNDLGPYRKAHNTEDQEIALRMQENGYIIDHCPDAYVYTSAPNTVPKLYRQRLRWVYGFLRNMVDYKRLIFKKQYGTVAMFTLPAGLISIFGIIFLFLDFIWNLGDFAYRKIVEIQTVGFTSHTPFHFDWFFVSTKVIILLIVVVYAFAFISIYFGKKISNQKATLAPHLLYFFVVYRIIAPFWLLKAIYDSIFSRESSWTLERNAL